MKIAIVSLGRSHLIHLASYLHSEGEDVIFYTMMPKARCREFGYNGKVKSLLFPVGLGEILIRKINASAYKKSYWRFTLRKLFDKLVSYCLKKCDILIALNGTSVLSSCVAKKKYGAMVICDQGSSYILHQNAVHYSYSDVPIDENQTNFMLKHYSETDYFMVPSKYVMETDIKHGIPEEKILYNPYGVDLDLFHPTPLPDDSECYDVLMVGSWWKHKGCDMLMEVCLNRLKLRLLHVGGVVDCELPHNNLFTHIDTVPEKELPKYYAKAKIFVMSSLDEGFGLVLIQAAACGLPIVGSNRTGLPDLKILLNDTPYCFVIEEPLNEDNLEKSIQEAITLSNQMPNGLRNPYMKSLSNISWNSYGERYYSILKKIR